MCFRPATAGAPTGPTNCPECGKELQIMPGMDLKECPFCHCDFTPYKNAPGAPGAPAAPGAPGAPKAPGAPGVPAAPKAPGA